VAVIEYGSSRDKPAASGDVEPVTEPIRSILDIGTQSIGSERESDSTVAENAGGSDGDGEATFDPASLSSARSDPDDRDAPFGRTPTGRARKRPVGSGTRSSSVGTTPRKSATEVSTFVADLLYGLHEIAANFTHTPELELSEDEAKGLGEATVRVAQEYDLPMPDAKTMAWINLLKVVSVVYGPRVGAVRIRKTREKASKSPFPIRWEA
jgi:hypothetical protein